MPDVLFQVTTENLETGLRGVPVGYVTTSVVDPTKGLYYIGKPVTELVHKSPEEVIYLLYHGKEPNEKELEQFKTDLAKRGHCSKETLEAIQRLPRHGHPTKLFTAAILVAGMLEGKNNYKEDCLNLIAKIPELVATVINYHAGWGQTPEPKPELGYMQNFTHMLNVPGKNMDSLSEVFRLFNILHYDHGGGNLSTFVGKAIASGLEDMYGSIAGSMCALAGPRHGKANQEVLEFVQKMYQELGDKATEESVEKYIREKLDKKEVVPGFGHAVLRVEDTRAQILYAIADKRFPDFPLVRLVKLIRTAGIKVLSENPKISDPYPNVDAISGIVLAASGFNYPEYFTVLFGLSRVVGIAIQIVYERLYARDGKGTPIIRPKYIYKPRTAT